MKIVTNGKKYRIQREDGEFLKTSKRLVLWDTAVSRVIWETDDLQVAKDTLKDNTWTEVALPEDLK